MKKTIKKGIIIFFCFIFLNVMFEAKKFDEIENINKNNDNLSKQTNMAWRKEGHHEEKEINHPNYSGSIIGPFTYNGEEHEIVIYYQSEDKNLKCTVEIHDGGKATNVGVYRVYFTIELINRNTPYYENWYYDWEILPANYDMAGVDLITKSLTYNGSAQDPGLKNIPSGV